MVRNKYYVVRKLADVIYALPVGQGIVRDYPVMQLGALEYDIVRKIDQDENPRKVFDELAISYMIAEEQRFFFGRIFCTAAEDLASCNIIQNYVVNEKIEQQNENETHQKVSIEGGYANEILHWRYRCLH